MGPPCAASGATWPTIKSVRGAAEAAVGDQRHRFAESLADERSRDGQHFAHAGTALGSFVANHDHVAGLNFSLLHGFECRFLGIEYPRRSCVKNPLVTGKLHDAAFGSERAAQNREAAFFLERI